MKAMEAERAALLASQLGPNNERAITPMAAQPIWAMNILYFRAPGDEGVTNRIAATAPRGAIVIEIPFGANIWSIFPNIAIAANAPAEGQKISLKEGVEAGVVLSGFQESQNGAETLLEATAPCLVLVILLLRELEPGDNLCKLILLLLLV